MPNIPEKSGLPDEHAVPPPYSSEDPMAGASGGQYSVNPLQGQSNYNEKQQFSYQQPMHHAQNESQLYTEQSLSSERFHHPQLQYNQLQSAPHSPIQQQPMPFAGQPQQQFVGQPQQEFNQQQPMPFAGQPQQQFVGQPQQKFNQQQPMQLSGGQQLQAQYHQHQPQMLINQNQQVQHSSVIITSTAPQQVVAAPPQSSSMGISVFSCLFCIWPIGLFAIIKASQANSAYARGDYAAAESNAKTARVLSFISIGIGIVLYISIVIFNNAL